MPNLPVSIWRRRVESEYENLSKGSYSFTVNSDKTAYDFSLSGVALQEVPVGSGNISKTNGPHKVRFTIKREFPYAGGFDLEWRSPIFHPNIHPNGKVCIQLVNKWSAGQTIANIMDALQQLLENPNPNSPLNLDAAQYFLEHPGALGDENLPKRQLKKPRVVK